MTTVSVRKWEEEDFEDCLEAFDSNMPEFFHPVERPLFVDFMKTMQDVSERNLQYFSVLLDGKVIGCGGICLTRELDKACMAWGMIHRDFHRSGYGKVLLEHRIACWEQFFPGFMLVLDTTQYSCPFFQRFGFVTTRITPDGYAPGMDRYDMIYRPD